ncbi:MAG: 23S rRNA (guanosine(2251)-2'-O)-methyltransferase RlmB [Clostridiales bacterium]|jgi:23S rRNA (guanosine2251-2'-O)-methyltransferase|nr:23S rRNA (guanosine(2251)-2'-O)-methyltransferase RlmB [Clostridiales bacterium]
MNKLKLEGKNAVIEALLNDIEIEKIFIDEKVKYFSLIKKHSEIKKIELVKTERKKLNGMSEVKNHQGVIAICKPKKYSTIDDIFATAKNKKESFFALILNNIIDPQNFGAIVRTSEACGIHGIIIPKKRSVNLSSSVIGKTSVGTVSRVNIVQVSNIVDIIKKLKNKNIWALCADTCGENLFNFDFNIPIVVVIGGEDNGISRLVRDVCDFKLKIPMIGKINSLNASVATGIFLYEHIRQKLKK